MLYSSSTVTDKIPPVTFLTEDENMMKETGLYLLNRIYLIFFSNEIEIEKEKKNWFQGLT